MIIFAVVGFAVVMLAAYVRRLPEKYPDFCVGVAIPIFCLLLLPIGAFTGWLRPITLDAAFRRWDLALGMDGFAFTRWLLANRCYVLVGPVYYSLPLIAALAWALERRALLLRSVVIGALLAFPLYLLLPAAGPQYAFLNFPDNNSLPGLVAWVHPRNCFPSMHLTWAILVAMNIRNARWRWFFVSYATLMGFATVASGEHYFIDEIAAVPFAFAVQKVAVLSAKYVPGARDAQRNGLRVTQVRPYRVS